jgi:hypothetical protein
MLAAGIEYSAFTMSVQFFSDNAGAKFGEFAKDGSWPQGLGETLALSVGYWF